MFKPLDIFKISFSALYIIIVTLLLSFQVDIEESIQDWLVMLTHAMGIPLIIVLWETQWVAITLVIGILLSIMAHMSVVFDWYVHRIEPLDIAFANLTLMLVAFIVIFDKIPEWTLPFLFTVTVLNTVFWDIMWVYSVLSGIINLSVSIFIAYRLCYPSKERNSTFMTIGLLLGITGTVFFLLDGKHGDKNYGLMHSVWHVCSYTSLYFGMRSLKPSRDTLRRPRIEFSRRFEIGKLAYH